MRLKEGEEKTNKLMEDKMLRIQKDVSNLKRDFKKIQQRNENLPREYQVPKEKFQMTDFTYKLIQEEIEVKMKEVVKSREAETEESKKVLENIRKRFFDPIQYNRVVVKGLKSKQELTTFRIAKMAKRKSGEEQAKDSITVQLETPESWTPRTPRGQEASGAVEEAELELGEPRDLGQQVSVSSGVAASVSRAKQEVKILNEQVAKALAKQEAKREKKMARKREWDELHST
jgi:hypothetical protein